ncbi:MAG: hypothetical protein GWM92_04095 [Gemmatimonadetes bacterium]|nr:hypothetical protein [Gemmatimonadota bacterium]NIR77736.1 hypothetical protein [Gemmatimonadota bacterium]NIT86273.1 hypothetical protein [Gemmatimonadota bacterium]NIU30106.1 hypothetical protein [Gemmatimonadota bacterium]NIU35052.1 hypothetical protein [Gemmatimonadota bacterium]
MKSAARITVALAGLAVATRLAACGGDPFTPRWNENADTVVIYSLARPEINLASAFDFAGRQPVEVQAPGATGSWDVALDTRDGQLVLLPPGALSIESDAGIARVGGAAFAEVEEAPRDTAAFVRDQPVPVETGTVYVVRTRLTRSTFRLCNRYAKFEPLSVSPGTGSLTFVFDTNPLCDDRRLVPPD